MFAYYLCLASLTLSYLIVRRRRCRNANKRRENRRSEVRITWIATHLCVLSLSAVLISPNRVDKQQALMEEKYFQENKKIILWLKIHGISLGNRHRRLCDETVFLFETKFFLFQKHNLLRSYSILEVFLCFKSPPIGTICFPSSVKKHIQLGVY